MEVLLQELKMVLSRNRQALTGDVSIRVEDGGIIAGKQVTLHRKAEKPERVDQFNPIV
jgi:hypothetical protein